jgi:hypothetical protein
MTRRIITAREQMALLAPWRTAASSEFPWAAEDRDWAYGEYGLYNSDTEAYHAPLENGHRLRVWDDTINEPRWGPLEEGGHKMGDLPPEPPKSHWKGGFDHGVDFPSDPEAHAAAGYPTNWKPSYTSVYEESSPLRAKAYPTKEQAMRAVEKRYRETFPIGTNTGKHDSGVDYSDLNKFMGDV